MEQKQRNSILLVLFVGVLMGALDIAIVGPALPAIRSQFEVTERALAWMFSIYVLFNLTGTPLMARMSDLYGRKLVYILDVGLFALGSLVVALARDFNLVLVGRAIQGLGAGGIFPVASAVIGDTFPPEKRGGALGLIGAVFGIAFLVGPLLGALIMALANWRWLFLINIPVAVIVIMMGLSILPGKNPSAQQAVESAAHTKGTTPRAQPTTPLDWPGMILLVLLLSSLAWGLNQLDTQDFLGSLVSISVLPYLAAFVLLLVALWQVERRASHPILPPGLFNRKQLTLAYMISAGAGLAEASLVFMPLLAVVSLQDAGITEKSASWMLMPVVLAMVVGSPLAGRLLDRWGSRTIILSGTSVMAAGMFLLGWSTGSMALFIIAGVLIGLGMSALLGAPLRYIMLNEARVSERSVAQGVVAVFTSAGQLLGSSLVGSIAASYMQDGDAAAGYSLAFVTIAVIGVALAVLSAWLKPRTEEQNTVQQNQREAAGEVL